MPKKLLSTKPFARKWRPLLIATEAVVADFNEANIEPDAASGDHEMAELIPGPMNGDILEDNPDVHPAESKFFLIICYGEHHSIL